MIGARHVAVFMTDVVVEHRSVQELGAFIKIQGVLRPDFDKNLDARIPNRIRVVADDSGRVVCRPVRFVDWIAELVDRVSQPRSKTYLLTNFMDTEFTQCRRFLAVRRSPSNT